MSSAYCTQADLTFVLTRFGLQALLNQGATPAPVIQSQVTSAINRASVRVDFYLRQRYDKTQLNNNDWVRWAAAMLAAVQIMRLKNAPHDGLQAEYDEVIEELKAVQQFEAEIPDAYPISEPGPTASNVRVSQWNFNRKIRVSESTSVGDQSSKKNRQPDYLDIILDW